MLYLKLLSPFAPVGPFNDAMEAFTVERELTQRSLTVIGLMDYDEETREIRAFDAFEDSRYPLSSIDFTMACLCNDLEEKPIRA